MALQPGSTMGDYCKHPVLLHNLPVYPSQISAGTHLEPGRIWLSLQTFITDPQFKPNNKLHQINLESQIFI